MLCKRILVLLVCCSLWPALFGCETTGGNVKDNKESQDNEKILLKERKVIDQLVNDGKRYDAIKAYQARSFSSPDSDTAHYLYGYALKNPQKKWKAFDQCLRVNPKQYWCMIGRGKIYIKWRVMDRAASDFESARTIHPQRVDALVGLAEIAESRQEDTKAIELYTQVLTKETNNTEALSGLARIYYRQKNWGKAITWFNKRLDLEPKHFDSLEMLADIYYSRTKQYAASIPVLEKALKIRPKHQKMYMFLADAYERTNDQDKALDVYERASKLPQVFFYTFFRLGVLRAKKNNREGGIEALEVAVKQRSDHEPSLLLLSDLYMQSKQPDKAIQLLRRLTRINGQNATYRAKLAQAFAQKEDYASALRQYQELMQLKPDDNQYRASLRKLLGKLGLSDSTYTGKSVRAVMDKGKRTILRCYRQRLKTNKALRGSLEARLIVSANGKVEKVTLGEVKNPLEDKIVQACVKWTFQLAIFPQIKRRVRLRYPISFRP
ncbi:MAG: tetratricopeptide repeat protein [Myxococcales bacterium]|nr:tetratricopeptide repeat protein [Myxococcales bacterium]